MAVTNYVVAGCKPWSQRAFDESIRSYPGQWHYIASPDQLTAEALDELAPRYVFFLHWSWKVPEEITSRFECVAFHMTDVPYGRGGSPLQNLIVRGHKDTKVTALRMVDELDAGPVYLKAPMPLDGSAEEIYLRSSYVAAKLIGRIIDEEIEPKPQSGQLVEFKRRRPHESKIPVSIGPEALYDFIRMLDAEGYPHAYLEHAGFRCEFRNAVTEGNRITASVSITPVRESSC